MTDVQVRIELGHLAVPSLYRLKKSLTHDWIVYVKGAEEYDIAHFVEKVVFHLYPSFENPSRVCKEPPYFATEQGNAGFEFPIEIYFKNNAEPNKIKLTYNLILHHEESYCDSRIETLTFRNPTGRFKKMLLKAGGVLKRPTEEFQVQNLIRLPIKTNLPQRHTLSAPSKEWPSRFNLDENLKNSNGISEDKDVSIKSLSLTATASTFGHSELVGRDESHVNKEKQSKERILSKDSASSWKQIYSPISRSKRLSESLHRNDPSKKLKMSSSFSDRNARDKDRESEKEIYKLKENKREKKLDKDKECEREIGRKQEKKSEREKDMEREITRLKEYERKKEKQRKREKRKDIQKEKQKLKITSQEQNDDLSFSDSSDSLSDMCSLASSSSSSRYFSDSNRDDHTMNSPKSHDSSIKAATRVTNNVIDEVPTEMMTLHRMLISTMDPMFWA